MATTPGPLTDAELAELERLEALLEACKAARAELSCIIQQHGCHPLGSVSKALHQIDAAIAKAEPEE